MHLAKDVKPITYLKTHTAEAIDDVNNGRTLVITQHGEARAVLLNPAHYDELHATIALLLKIARGEEDIRAGRVTPHREVMADLRRRQREARERVSSRKR